MAKNHHSHSDQTTLANECEHAARAQMQLSLQHHAEALRYYCAGMKVKGDMLFDQAMSEKANADAFIRRCKKIRRAIGLESKEPTMPDVLVSVP